MEVEASSLASDLIGLVAIVVLVLLNGFFVSAEFALVSVRRTRIDELVAQGSRAAEVVHKAIHDPDRFIAATQLGITLSSLGLGWLGEPALAHLFEPLLDLIPIPEQWANITSHGLSVALAFALITFLHVVVGELSPKSIALQRPEQTALIVARPTLWAEWLFRPGIWVLNGAGNWLVRMLGFQPASGHELSHSLEEIKMLLAASAARGLLDDSEHDMLGAIFSLRGMLARQVMIPRTEMAALPAQATLRDLLLLQRERQHGKFPVYENDLDHIIGIIYMRDVFEPLARGNLDQPLRSLMRPAVFLPETARIHVALAAFRENRQHIAIVLDEYGGTAGLITLDDILEEISGEMPSLFDMEAPEIVRNRDGSWTVSGLALIETINEKLGLALVDDIYDTIGGYVMGKLERIPQTGDEVSVAGVRFRVEQVDGLRADRLRIFLDASRWPEDHTGG